VTIERSGGGPLPDDYLDINPATGQQKAYVVLSPEERAKGFVRPVRRSYIHKPCGTLTTMAQDIAETYARNPKFYSGTFCCGCKTHYPLNEFVWDGTDEVMGSDVEVKPLPAPLRDLIAEAEANAVAPRPGLVRPRIEVTDQMVSRFLCMPLPRTFPLTVPSRSSFLPLEVFETGLWARIFSPPRKRKRFWIMSSTAETEWVATPLGKAYLEAVKEAVDLGTARIQRTEMFREAMKWQARVNRHEDLLAEFVRRYPNVAADIDGIRLRHSL